MSVVDFGDHVPFRYSVTAEEENLTLASTASDPTLFDVDMDAVDTTPYLQLVYSEGYESRELFNDYYNWRRWAEEEPKAKTWELELIREDAARWAKDAGVTQIPEDENDRVRMYSTFSRELVEQKIGGLVEYLRQNHSHQVSEAELVATEKFIESAFAMYEDEAAEGREVLDDADGKFAFVVPARVSRKNTEYGEEVEPVIPALRYLPNEMRAQMMVGLPPFVIDTYQYDKHGRRGVLVLAPVFDDMREDITSPAAVMKVAQNNVNEAVDFAHRRFGVSVVGLGATLPALTLYGKKITNKNVVTTTGHGGTTELIARTMEAGLAAKGQELTSIGVMGMGAIGASAAEVIAQRYPNVPVSVYDTTALKAHKVALRNPDRITVAESDQALVRDSQVIISAITGKFDTDKIIDMHDKLVVDDAQPGSFSPQAVSQLGGHVLWVIGRDATGEVANRSGYDYGTLVQPNTDVFGCEAEAAVIAAYIDDLEDRGMGPVLSRRIAEKVAIRSAVDVQKVRYISALFKKFGIVASEPQAFGKPVDLA